MAGEFGLSAGWFVPVGQIEAFFRKMIRDGAFQWVCKHMKVPNER
jgi:hypothetical protein